MISMMLQRCALRLPVLALAAASMMPLPALAELMLNPTRVILAKNQRAAQVELINNSSGPASYRITLVNRRMSETGEFITIDKPGPGEQFADAMLRYSPRQVTLQPGTAQVVRLMVRKPDGLPEGEYRSHLHFEKLPDALEMPGSVEGADKNDGRIGVVLKTLIGASIPVIVRHGASDGAVALGQLEVLAPEPGKAPVLAFQIKRSGNSSVYGDLSATYIPDKGPAQVLARAGGVAVYTPNTIRRASLSLPLTPGMALVNGQLRLAFHERPDAGGKLLAEATLALP